MGEKPYQWMHLNPAVPHVFKCKNPDCGREVPPWEVFCNKACRDDHLEQERIAGNE